MNRKVFKLLVPLSVSALLSGAFLAGPVWAQKKGEPIIVGAPVPRASAYGQNGERGMILAAEEINAAGGVKMDGAMRPLQLEIIDTRDEEPGVPTSEVLLAIEKLILQKKADVIAGGPCMSECGMAALDLYARYKRTSGHGLECYVEQTVTNLHIKLQNVCPTESY